jgi:hypothetical protein
MDDDPPKPPPLLGWGNVIIGSVLELRHVPPMVDLLRIRAHDLSGTALLIGGLYQGLGMTLGLLSLAAGVFLLKHRRHGPVASCAAGGAILMNAAYHLLRYGPSWTTESLMPDQAARAAVLFVPDLLLGGFSIFNLWTFLSRPAPGQPPGKPRWPALAALASAALCWLLNQAIHVWIPSQAS